MSLPELIDTTGIRALTARRIDPARSGLGIETTRPSGRLSTASSIRVRMRGTLYVSGELYVTDTSIWRAAASMPLCTIAQNALDA